MHKTKLKPKNTIKFSIPIRQQKERIILKFLKNSDKGIKENWIICKQFWISKKSTILNFENKTNVLNFEIKPM